MIERASLTITRRQRVPRRERIAEDLRSTWPHLAAWFERKGNLGGVMLDETERAYGECCQRVADERVQSGRRAHFGWCVAALSSFIGAAVAAWVFGAIAGTALQSRDWIVAGLTAPTLAVLYLMLPTMRRSFLVVSCGALLALSIAPVYAAPAAVTVWMTAVATERTAMALGLVLGVVMLMAGLVAGGTVHWLSVRSERRRSVRTVPDLVAFDALHAIVSAMTRSSAVIGRTERVKLASDLADAAKALPNIPNVFLAVDLPQQRAILQAKLDALATKLRSWPIFTGTAVTDTGLLTDCLDCLACITLGRFGELPDPPDGPEPPPGLPWGRYARYLQIRLSLLALISLIAVAVTTVRPVAIGTGRLVVIGCLLAAFVMLTPDIGWLRSTVRSLATRLASRLARLDDEAERQPRHLGPGGQPRAANEQGEQQ